MAEVVIPYAPRPQQLLVHDALEANRFAVAVCHRRFGKTVAAINHLIRAAMLCGKESPRYAYVAPTYSQAKRVAFDYLLKFTEPLTPTANISELRVDFYGRRISLYGADNPDSLRGIYLDGVVLDEVGDMNPKVWNEVLRPALTDRLGWALFIGTPKGANHFKDLRDRAEKEEGWALLEFKASQTGIISPEELEAATTSSQLNLSVPLMLRLRVRITARYLIRLHLNALRSSRQTASARRTRLGTWELGIAQLYGFARSRGRRGGSSTTLRTTVKG